MTRVREETKKAARPSSVIDAPIKVPDILGDQGRQDQTDRLVAEMLHNVAQERVRLNVLQRANLIDEDDAEALVPGTAITFHESFKQLDKNERQIAEAFGAEVMDRIPAVIEQMRAGK